MVDSLSASLLLLYSAGPTLVIGAVCSWLLLRALIPQLRRRLLDQPNDRSAHLVPTPRGGGVAFVVVASASSAIALLTGQASASAALPLLVTPLAVVGVLDDRHNLPASWRYGVQLLTAVLVLGFSPLVQVLSVAFASGSLFLLPVVALLLIAVTAVINFTNFMDGLDGLVAGSMAVAISALAFELSSPWPLWALVGASGRRCWWRRRAAWRRCRRCFWRASCCSSRDAGLQRGHCGPRCSTFQCCAVMGRSFQKTLGGEQNPGAYRAPAGEW